MMNGPMHKRWSFGSKWRDESEDDSQLTMKEIYGEFEKRAGNLSKRYRELLLVWTRGQNGELINKRANGEWQDYDERTKNLPVEVPTVNMEVVRWENWIRWN